MRPLKKKDRSLHQYRGSFNNITIDYVMKHEETRARECSRENCGKREIAVHGALAKHKTNDKDIFKRVH